MVLYKVVDHIFKERRRAMLFTSPVFMFVFLPASICLYALLGNRWRRQALAAISFCFFLLLNISAPLNLLYIAGLIAYSYVSASFLRRYRKAWLCAATCVLPYIVWFTVRMIAYFNEGFAYPIGLTVSVIFSTSYIVTQYRSREKAVGNLLDLALYISFFPVIIVGPLIRFTDFVHLVKRDNISFDISNVASGARLFAIGVIKRIAVGAVLFDMYYVFFTLFSESPNFIVMVFMLVSVYFATFFTIAGYMDIGVGLSRMYGFKLETFTVADPFHASTLTMYFGNLFNGLLLWLDDYITEPLLSFVGRDKQRLSSLVRALCCGIVFIFFIRSSPFALTLIAPAVVFFYIAYRTRLDEWLAERSGLRTLMTVLTMTAVASFWVFMTLGDPLQVVESLDVFTSDVPEYRMDQVLSTFSWIKYLFVMLLAGVVMWTSRVESYMRAPELSKQKVYPLAQYLSLVCVILLFLLTVIFFMPQYSTYDTVPFLHLFM